MEKETQLQIDLVFSEQIKLNNSISLTMLDEKQNKYNVFTTFVERRKEPFQTVIGVDLHSTLENLRKSIELDHGRVFKSEIIESGIRLSALQPNWIFDRYVFDPIELPIRVIPDEIILHRFAVQSIEYLPSDINVCNNVKIRIVTNSIMNGYCVDQTCFLHNSNIVELERFRGSGFNIQLTDSNFQRINLNIITPPLIEDGYDNIIVISVLNGFNGGSVTINAPFPTQLEHRFSLDNINWQDSNTFSGLLEGFYTVWIKDKYGCVRTKDFQIDPYTNNIVRNNNFHYISKSNSIRFAKRDQVNSYKTDENTLSCEVDVLKPYKQIQLFKPTDKVKTQFKSNYAINKAFVYNGNSQTPLIVQRMTNNLDLKDKRSAIKFNLNNGKTGIYFISGAIFNYDTGAPIGPYELNGNLPEWAKKGNKFQMDNTWFQILDTYFDTNKNAEIIIINNIYLGIETGTIVAAQYNRENYNVYEFSINMQDYRNNSINVGIELITRESAIYTEKIKYLSEQIQVCDHCENTLEIRYKNTHNTDIMYSTGIENILRIPVESISGKDINTSENYKTDDQVILLDADIYESNEFRFEPLTKELWRKLKIALSHDSVYIDGTGYIKEDDFETEGPLGQTNLYVLTAKMTKTGQSYSNRRINDIIIIDDTPIEISGFINVDSDSFIRI